MSKKCKNNNIDNEELEKPIFEDNNNETLKEEQEEDAARAGDSGESSESEIRSRLEGLSSSELIDLAMNQQNFIAASVAKCEELTNIARRVQADFDNYRRRNNDSIKMARDSTTVDVIERFLPTLDIIDQALSMIKDEQTLSGIKMMRRQLMDVFSSFGVTEIESLNEIFDPALHEAVMSEASEGEPGTVLQVFRKGYKLGEKVIRYASVKVSG